MRRFNVHFISGQKKLFARKNFHIKATSEWRSADMTDVFCGHRVADSAVQKKERPNGDNDQL